LSALKHTHSGQEYGMIVCIYIAFALKCIEMLHSCVEQSLTETFFIDWERPRGTVIPLKGEDAQIPPTVANTQPQSPVTVWRTYMIANEWNELQNYRKTNLPLQLFVVIFILLVLNLEGLALAAPHTQLCKLLTRN
jgi:meckelin